MRKLVFISFWLSVGAIGAPRYTPIVITEKWKGVVHPNETPRGDAFLKSIRQGAYFVGCAAIVNAFADNGTGKVFHGHVIGATVYRLTLDPARPASVRYGAFSDEAPQVDYGVASFTTGRHTLSPNELKPDVTGLTLFSNHQSWTATASRGAFARSGPAFARLAGYPALAQMALGFMSVEELKAAHQKRQAGAPRGDNPYLREPGMFRRAALTAGELAGEGAFIARDPVPGLGTLLPAVLSGRRSPFPGYSDIGFGTDTRLLTEDVPLEQRQAFRLQFTLADTEINRKLLSEIPGWLATISNNLRGTPDDEHNPVYRNMPGNHLSAQFHLWMKRQNISIDYDVWMVLENVNQRSKVIEKPHLRFDGQKIHLGTLSLLSYGDDFSSRVRALYFAEFANASPGHTHFLPVGDLAWYRTLAEIMAESREANQPPAVGAYVQSNNLRIGLSREEQAHDLESLIANFRRNSEGP